VDAHAFCGTLSCRRAGDEAIHNRIIIAGDQKNAIGYIAQQL
jgi:hypothetical protein